MSSIDLDRNHTTALCGGDCQSYQGHKKQKTTNAIYVTDRQGIPLAISSPVAGSHNDLYNISEVVKEVFSQLTKSNISTDGLFLNANIQKSVEQIWCYFDKLASMELYSIYCYSDEESEKETKVKISSIWAIYFSTPYSPKIFPKSIPNKNT